MLTAYRLPIILAMLICAGFYNATGYAQTLPEHTAMIAEGVYSYGPIEPMEYRTIPCDLRLNPTNFASQFGQGNLTYPKLLEVPLTIYYRRRVVSWLKEFA